jgi:hypothetical protein
MLPDDHVWPDELDRDAQCSRCWLPYSEWDGSQECTDEVALDEALLEDEL